MDPDHDRGADAFPSDPGIGRGTSDTAELKAAAIRAVPSPPVEGV